MTVKEFCTNIADSIRFQKKTTEKIKAEDFPSEIRSLITNPTLQDKSITITENGTTTVTADAGNDGLNSVEIKTNVVGLIPEGTLSIRENGIYDVTEKANVDVNVQGGGGKTQQFTGHYDVEGLKQIGWSDEEIQYYQDNGVVWNEEQDIFLKLNEKELLGDNSNTTRFIPKNSSVLAFSGYTRLMAIPELNTSNVTSMYRMFYDCLSLIAIPELDTSKVTSMSDMFSSCYSLNTIPELNTSNVTSMSNMFSNCSALTTIPELDTSKVTSMSNMFYYCSALKTIPQLNTSNATSMDNMFYYCKALIAIPELDTSKVTSMSSMFYGCSTLKAIPELDTSKVTSMSSMFSSCNTLKSVPELDTSKVTNMSSMFSSCRSLNTIPELNTSNVTSMSNMFSNCSALTTIPELDTSKVTSMSNILSSCSSLVNLQGFKNLGQAYSTAMSASYSYYSITLSACTKLTHDSIMNVINNLYDIATKGCKAQKLVLGSTNLAKISNEEKAIATTKGWTLS